MVLKEQRAEFPVGSPADHHERRGESQDLEVPGQLDRIPHPAMTRLQAGTVCRLTIDLGQEPPPGLFRLIWLRCFHFCSFCRFDRPVLVSLQW
jgi:hypothetical protein